LQRAEEIQCRKDEVDAQIMMRKSGIRKESSNGENCAGKDRDEISQDIERLGYNPNVEFVTSRSHDFTQPFVLPSIPTKMADGLNELGIHLNSFISSLFIIPAPFHEKAGEESVDNVSNNDDKNGK
jgi:hypothetical protein